MDAMNKPEPMREAGLELRLMRRTPAQPRGGHGSVYRFAMFVPDHPRSVGLIEWRPGDQDSIQLYAGQIGYGVSEEFRGRRLAGRSLRLLMPLARHHDYERIWITCKVDNLASRRSCEWAGAVLDGIVDLPPDHSLYLRGDRQMCRYRLELRVESSL
ncbi:GNAT family N-acetyltransferase [bacterium]|nr:GNAT family N-acetyltransferase [bacterium]